MREEEFDADGQEVRSCSDDEDVVWCSHLAASGALSFAIVT